MTVSPGSFWDNNHPGDHHHHQENVCYLHGFPLHAHCWTLIERIVGRQAETDLALFTQVLYERWNEQPSPFEVSNCLDGRFWDSSLDDDGRRCHPEALISAKDPINVPEVEELFRLSVRQGYRERLRKKRSTPHSSTLAKVQKKKKKKQNLHPRLPIDIVYLILNHMHHSASPDSSPQRGGSPESPTGGAGSLETSSGRLKNRIPRRMRTGSSFVCRRSGYWRSRADC
ncbi:hypothetical protein VTN77DRAFT_2682 [Rasamsonia byssochlamydoides]|uniref:uncharacterized protein n=1 Tax=Rasamsonia byssochlamydoides TaxID=89139 RepID=UPI003743E813